MAVIPFFMGIITTYLCAEYLESSKKQLIASSEEPSLLLHAKSKGNLLEATFPLVIHPAYNMLC